VLPLLGETGKGKLASRGLFLYPEHVSAPIGLALTHTSREKALTRRSWACSQRECKVLMTF